MDLVVAGDLIRLGRERDVGIHDRRLLGASA